MLLDSAIADRKSETGSAVLSGEERREDVRQVLLVDSRAVVTDVHSDELGGIGVIRAQGEFRLYMRGNGHACRFGLECVLHQIQEDLDELAPISHNEW